MSGSVPFDVERFICASCQGAIQVTFSNGNFFSSDCDTVLAGELLYHAVCWDAEPRVGPFVRNPWHRT